MEMNRAPWDARADGRIAKVAARANAGAYDSLEGAAYLNGSPHLRHASLRTRYGALVVEAYDRAAAAGASPRVLDLGAGDGSATLPFLDLGARVTAVDASKRQLAILRERCKEFDNRLETRCGEAADILSSEPGAYDIIVANSFLHHVPDYLALIRSAALALAPGGQFFSFQDPLRYDTMGAFGRNFSKIAYLSWRIFGGDLVGGAVRRLRRARGIYRDDCPADNVEYHVVRNGVDQDAIETLLGGLGFECRIIRYFSTQNPLFQRLGETLGVKNTFSVVARKRA